MKCVDCGNIVFPIPNRLPICDCGCIQMVDDKCAFYIELCFEKKDILYIKNFKNEVVHTLSNPETMLEALSQYEIRYGEKEKEKILNRLKEMQVHTEEKLEYLKLRMPTHVVKHYIMYKNSKPYKKVFEELDNTIIDEIITSGFIMKHIEKDKGNLYPPIEKIIETYNEYAPKLDALASRMSLFEHISYNADADLCVTLANIDIDLDEFYKYQAHCSQIMSGNDVLALVLEFSKLGYRGGQIFDKVEEYFFLITKVGIYFSDIEFPNDSLENIMTFCRQKIAQEEKKYPLSKILTDKIYMNVDGTDIREMKGENYTISEITPYEYFANYSEHSGLWTSQGLIVKKPLKIVENISDKVMAFVVYDGNTLTVKGLVNPEIIKLINKYHEETEEDYPCM